MYSQLHILHTQIHLYIHGHLFFFSLFLQTLYKFAITLLRTPFLSYLIVTVAIKLYLNLLENIVLFFVFGTRRIVCSFFLLCALNENIIISCKCLHLIVKTRPSIINSSSCDRKKARHFIFFLTFLNFYLVEFYYCVAVFVNNLVDFIGNFIYFVHFFLLQCLASLFNFYLFCFLPVVCTIF